MGNKRFGAECLFLQFHDKDETSNLLVRIALLNTEFLNENCKLWWKAKSTKNQHANLIDDVVKNIVHSRTKFFLGRKFLKNANFLDALFLLKTT